MSDSAAPASRPGQVIRRGTSIGSFHAGYPLPILESTRGNGHMLRRQSTQHHYHTFPTAPPKTPGRERNGSHASDLDHPMFRDPTQDQADATPLAWNQLALLALLSLCEQTALNSISPYLPAMVSSFPEIDQEKVGLYVGLLASSFALAQLTTNLVWGYASDMMGRKPVMLLGTTLLCVCFAFFGFCTKYWHVLLVHIAMGLLNGNAAVVPTCLGELTDRSNQSRAFTWLPVVYSLGSITGPALGGVLVGTVAADKYRFLAPNLLIAVLLALSVFVLLIWFEETLEEQGESIDWSEHLQWLLFCARRAKKTVSRSVNATFSRQGNVNPPPVAEIDDDETREERALLSPGSDEDGDSKSSSDQPAWRQILNRTTLFLLLTYLIFQVSNISFGNLYVLFASGKPPTGRGLSEEVIGFSLSAAGIITILFQLLLFRPLKSKLGNLGTYRGSLLGLAIGMMLMPWVGYADSDPPLGVGSSRIWLYAEMGAVLVIRNICAVGGLSSVMLLITNSAPSHASLGTLNGMAQTLSAAGRSFGPFASGSLFSALIHVRPKGEALVWGLFGGIALMGWLGSYAVRGEGLESTDDGFEEEDYEDCDGRSAS